MKEIDLLPEWYKSGRRRQVGYRTQYVALSGIFILMLVWNFITSHSISKAEAQLAHAESKQAVLDTKEFEKLKNQIAPLQKKTNVLDEIDSKIDVASVLAELSFLIDKKIVLRKLSFNAEMFTDNKSRKANYASAVRVAGGNSARNKSPFLGDVRFKMVINGIASDAGDVAELVCKLEDSPYFCLVYPSFSRNAEIKTPNKSTAETFQVSEFEIGCYLANYRQK